MNQLNEKCGVIGVYSSEPDAARLVYYGLWALQHRGQENSGIASTTGKKIFCHKGKGLVSHVYNDQDLDTLKGHIALGHNRYSTFGKSTINHSQPVFYDHNSLALVHNGNLPKVNKLKHFLSSKGISTINHNDSELIYKAIEYHYNRTKSIETAISKSFTMLTGAFSLIIMTKTELVAVRDEYGIRPLVLGKINGSFIFASETCALDTIGAEYIRDVQPGEIVIINNTGIKSIQLKQSNLKMDVFEFIYFARPDSTLLNKSVYQVRKNLGIQLAKEFKFKADMVIPVPDSAIPSAIGFSHYSKIPLEEVLVKNRYIHRTFIRPAQKQRTSGVKMKLNLIKASVRNKIIVIIDDSIVRGTTSKTLVELVKQGKPKKIYFLVTSPPVKYPDFYGIDTPNQSELIAAKLSHLELEKFLGVDKLYFVSYEGMLKAIGVDESNLCLSCFNGKYPIDIGSNIKKINWKV